MLQKFLCKFEVNVARVVAVLLFASAFEEVLAFVLSVASFSGAFRVEPVFAGLSLLVAVLAYCKLHLGVGLWMRHRWAVVITFVLLCVAAVGSILAAILLPLGVFKISISGYSNTLPSTYERWVFATAVCMVSSVLARGLYLQRASNGIVR